MLNLIILIKNVIDDTKTMPVLLRSFSSRKSDMDFNKKCNQFWSYISNSKQKQVRNKISELNETKAVWRDNLNSKASKVCRSSFSFDALLITEVGY